MKARPGLTKYRIVSLESFDLIESEIKENDAGIEYLIALTVITLMND
jgi:hypothetical protein